MSAPDAGSPSIPSPSRARIVVVEEHEVVRAGLRSMLDGLPDIQVVAEATDGCEAVEICCRAMPDIVLMDLRMPQMDGLTATRLIKQRCPGVSVLIVTLHEDPDSLLRAIKAGASGYVPTTATRRELVTAIRAMLKGEAPFSRRLTYELFQRLTAAEEMVCEAVETLTPREIDVLQRIARGKTNRQIAEELVVSAGTIKVHVHHIIAKLHVSDRTEAAVRALELGIVEPGSH